MAKANPSKTLVLSEYSSTSLIGKGSFSEVYEGIHKVSGEKVAIKIISKKNLTKGKVDVIVSEIEIMKLLNHSNIVRMLEFKWDEKNVYLVLEYCEGGNLSEYIKRLIRLPEVICRRAIQQLAMGLAYLRLKEISHMDLKPKNLLIKYKPFTLKIADFGLSQYLSERACTESVRGSPLYMAPEIILKKRYNYKVDLWSVGVILYECIYGKAPFSDKTYKGITEAMIHETPIQYSKRVAVSEDCMSLLKGLLVYDPNNRMNFDDFFNHPFVDVVHAPTEENKKLAIHILHEAVKYDEQKKYPEAFSAYCRALRYMVPILHSLKESYKWTSMHLKVSQCLSRAEELKVTLAQYNSQQEDIEACLKNDKKHQSKDIENLLEKNALHTGQMDIINCISSSSFEHGTKFSISSTSSHSLSGKPENTSTSSKSNQSEVTSKESSSSTSNPEIERILTDQDTPGLKDLFQSTPKVYDALEIGMTGQMYMAEGDYVTAYNKFEGSLNVLIPHIKTEPPGLRKDLLVRQVQWWLTQAESAKALAAARDVDAECSLKQKIFETADCSIQ
ncbi:unnamed protein product [Nezara viridula]|uniref:Serine/threonine-protein kinase ULK3 n=1 Tax=Nezara viridula TaxID=85310 RepID=A0A9P0HRX9_NEZVI|nr:unnamed protein product [Nezara viridula]